jgi:DNA-binding NtrC family response regulator
MSPRVLVVVRDRADADRISAELSKDGCTTVVAAYPIGNVEALMGSPIDVLVLELRFDSPPGSGLDFVFAWGRRQPRSKTVLIARPYLAEYLRDLGVFVSSPADPSKVAAAVSIAIKGLLARPACLALPTL